MKFLRILRAALAFFIFGLGSLSLSLGILPLFKLFIRNEAKKKQAAVWLIQFTFKIFIFLLSALWLIKVDISEEDRRFLAQLEGALVVANHPSLIDIVILISLVNRPVCITKGKLLNNFFVRSIIQSAYIANVGDIDEVVQQSAASLKSNYNFIIFPEGTRTVAGQKNKPPLKRGAAQIALQAGADIIPIHIGLEPPILQKGKSWHDVGEARAIYRLEVQKPIKTSSFSGNNASANINSRKITELLKSSLKL